MRWTKTRKSPIPFRHGLFLGIPDTDASAPVDEDRASLVAFRDQPAYFTNVAVPVGRPPPVRVTRLEFRAMHVLRHRHTSRVIGCLPGGVRGRHPTILGP